MTIGVQYARLVGVLVNDPAARGHILLLWTLCCAWFPNPDTNNLSTCAWFSCWHSWYQMTTFSTALDSCLTLTPAMTIFPTVLDSCVCTVRGDLSYDPRTLIYAQQEETLPVTPGPWSIPKKRRFHLWPLDPDLFPTKRRAWPNLVVIYSVILPRGENRW